ncbi:MAG: hypothetical protein RLZZ373_2620 [Pseudomonadota bacterium]|jgi:hypothetical protein
MKPQQQSPDWAAMIEQMCDRGLSYNDIGLATQSVLTVRMVRHYASGVQPLHWRGEQMIALWCETLQRSRADLPLAEVLRGHRRDGRRDHRSHDTGPRLQTLPAWPPAPQPAVKPVKRKYVRRAVAEVP